VIRRRGLVAAAVGLAAAPALVIPGRPVVPFLRRRSSVEPVKLGEGLYHIGLGGGRQVQLVSGISWLTPEELARMTPRYAYLGGVLIDMGPPPGITCDTSPGSGTA
jgi:hypothetical protein